MATIRSFEVAIARGDIRSAARCVAGANPDAPNPYTLRLLKSYRMHIAVTDLDAKVAGQTALATLRSRWILLDKALIEAKPESVNLILVGNDWLIGPLDWPMSMKDGKLVAGKRGWDPKPVQIVAWMVANSTVAAAICIQMEAQMKAAAVATASMVNAKKIAMACLMYASDNDDCFPKRPTMYRDALLPYLDKKDARVFTAPDDKPGTVSYRMNPNLAGRSTTAVEDPSRTILIYLGKNGKLDFRYGARRRLR